MKYINVVDIQSGYTTSYSLNQVKRITTCLAGDIYSGCGLMDKNLDTDEPVLIIGFENRDDVIINENFKITFC